MIIETATSEEDISAICRIRRQVFEYEMGLRLPVASVPEDVAMVNMIARLELNGEPIAALTVVDTTNEFDLRNQYGLTLSPDARLARYTQLAVSRPYRGMNLHLMLILEAHYQFVAPGDYTHTWLLFDAKRAANSSLCARLGFSASERIYQSQFGDSRILVRDERSLPCQHALWQTQRYLTAMREKNLRSCDYCPMNNNHSTLVQRNERNHN